MNFFARREQLRIVQQVMVGKNGPLGKPGCTRCVLNLRSVFGCDTRQLRGTVSDSEQILLVFQIDHFTNSHVASNRLGRNLGHRIAAETFDPKQCDRTRLLKHVT